ncbi:MAG TPA: ComEC/Rec2 family competence protein [Nocardioides sp.]|uniref:ComEC/Rec2 family competence protein n=1 Tax=Nocardioides sp. TaxID=35761 RepID=UPI002E32AE61|nr:ComEC/Rec2 family competence protein [Nocardioides sp.]HEX5087307.1 ComEC/Rec2 family competence protein [Nocardioides sp.]
MTPDAAPASIRRLDPRMPVLGAAAWLGAVAGTVLHGRPLVSLALAVVVGCAAIGVVGRRHPGLVRSVAALLLVALAAGSIAALRFERVAHNPVSALADDGAAVTLLGTVTSDPHLVAGGFSETVVWRLAVHRVTGRGRTIDLAAPVLVLGSPDDARVPLGATVWLRGRLVPADDRDLAAMVRPSGNVELVGRPGAWWRAASVVRRALRESVAHRPADQRALVPALVDGDDAEVAPGLQDDFRTTGLTHLLAVSGTNLTLVVGFLLWLARWCRVRGRWLHLVAAAGIAGFVLIARTEPSVLRAAVMGTIGLVALGADGRHRALRGLGTAVLVLVLVDPGLAVSAGFALSVLATGGILLLAPAWRDALVRWLPRWLAEAVAVPAAAQLACTPLVAAISGQVSLVAVAANLLVAPVVGPATVLGLAGGLLTLLWAPVGRLCGTLASWCVAWLVTVAHHGAALPTPAVGWGTGPVALALLVVASAVIAMAAPRLLVRPVTALGAAGVLVVAVLVRPPTFGWPPDGWVLVACDVGQGDGLVLDAGPGRAVVVDAGPEPRAMDRCLDRLRVREVPLLVLTHFHADHVDGISGVLAGRRVGAVETTRLLDPPGGVHEVEQAASGAGLVAAPAPYAATLAVGSVSLQVLWPRPDSPRFGPGDGSTANEASVVLLVQVAGLRLLLTGDVEPEGQGELARLVPGLHVDVLKMPHHGSRYQDEGWLLSLQPRVVLVSVGADNDYGQPARSSLQPLADAGAEVLRTDQDGDLAVVADGGLPRVVTSR